MTEAKGSNIWQLSETCYVNLNIGVVYCLDSDIYREYPFGKKQKYAPKILELFLKEQGKQLTYDEISRYAWENRGNEPASEHDIQFHVSKLNTMGELGGFIRNIPLQGYVFHCPALKEIDRIPDLSRMDAIPYFESLWKNHSKGAVRDQVAINHARELIDFYVVPDFISDTPSPFSGSGCSYVTAGSGFGKTTLLHMAVLVNIVDALKGAGSSVISDNSLAKYDAYQTAKTALFGENAPRYFPVFLYAGAANKCSFDCVLELAEGYATKDFERMVDHAEQAGNLLLLIDSIDEVEHERINTFLDGVQKLLDKYPKARVILTSRPLGKKQLPFTFQTVGIKELGDEAIHKIIKLILTDKRADILIDSIGSNPYLHSLVKNPFMLSYVINEKGERLLYPLLATIVTAIIDRRWDMQDCDILTEDVKLLLGHLACRFVFGNDMEADIHDVRRSFLKTEEIMAQYGKEFHIPERNLDRFLRMLSCQSGILNITNRHQVEKYVFQDAPVMCWLAANFIRNVLDNASDIISWPANAADIWSNALWIERFLHNFARKGASLSPNAVNTLVLVLVSYGSEGGSDMQKSILYYLLFRDATSCSATEKENIAAGYQSILSNTFGENDIANHPDSDCRKMIRAMQNT